MGVFEETVGATGADGAPGRTTTMTMDGVRTAPVYAGDLAVGDAGPVLRHRLTRTDLVRYAGASGDYNPMHHDEVKAVAAGQPSVFGHGMFSMGLLATAIERFVGVGRLTRYAVRFSRQTWPDEELSTSVVVTAIRDEDGRHLVDLDVQLANADGEVKVVGTATACLPARG
jgi:acyl dehydratase